MSIDTKTNKVKLNIVLEKEGDNKWPYSIKQAIKLNQKEQINLSDIILKLKSQNFTDFFDSSVSYYNVPKNTYIYCCFLPKTLTEREITNDAKYQKTININNLKITASEIQCQLKFRKKVKSKIEMLKQQQKNKYSQTQQETKKAKQKEKTIGEVIEKVALWRKLYTGFENQEGRNVHLELEKAAEQIGVIKKTLDDYLLQIRNGKRYGFNFQKRKNQKIGELRTFVKEKRDNK